MAAGDRTRAVTLAQQAHYCLGHCCSPQVHGLINLYYMAYLSYLMDTQAIFPVCVLTAVCLLSSYFGALDGALTGILSSFHLPASSCSILNSLNTVLL